MEVLTCLASVAHAVTQAFGGAELEDGLRTDVQLLRLHAHSGVCTSPTVMLNLLWGMARVIQTYVVSYKTDIFTLLRPDSESFGK